MAIKGRKSGSRGFAGIPRDVMKHPDYMALKATAKCLLQELAFQYRGSNNGDLTLAKKVLKERGFNSPNSINEAKKQLLEAGMIILTRQGGFNSGCSLYALTWQSIDECKGKLDCKSTITAPRSFRLNHPVSKQYLVGIESVPKRVNLNDK